MSRAEEYRGFVKKLRREAENAPPELRQTKLMAAENWELVAEEAEQSARQTAALRPR
jgi:hypothetical protein